MNSLQHQSLKEPLLIWGNRIILSDHWAYLKPKVQFHKTLSILLCIWCIPFFPKLAGRNWNGHFMQGNMDPQSQIQMNTVMRCAHNMSVAPYTKCSVVLHTAREQHGRGVWLLDIQESKKCMEKKSGALHSGPAYTTKNQSLASRSRTPPANQTLHQDTIGARGHVALAFPRVK